MRTPGVGNDEDYNYEMMGGKKSRKQANAEKKAAQKEEKRSRKRGRAAQIEAEIAAAEAAVEAGTLTGMHTVNEMSDAEGRPSETRTRRQSAGQQPPVRGRRTEEEPAMARRTVRPEEGSEGVSGRARRPVANASGQADDMDGRGAGDRPRRSDRDAERAQAERAVVSKPVKQSRKSRQIAANGTTVMDDEGKEIRVKNRPVKKAKISRDTLADTERALSDDAFDYEQLEKSLADITEQVMSQTEERPRPTMSSVPRNMTEVGERKNHDFDVDFVDL